jgi:16S rRNA (uracil1498-N3)-methyltransferase
MGADGSPAAGDRPWRSAAAQVFVADLDAPELSEDDAHHLQRVLRLGPGELVCAADGRGGWRLCHLERGALSPAGDVGHLGRPAPALTVGFAPVKGDRPEWAVQKLTEVGVDRVLLVQTTRSVVRWDEDRARRHLDRLWRVVREAAQQCRRLWLPELDVVPLEQMDAAAVLADAGGRPLDPADHTVVVGPEGGWSPEERAGREVVGLADHVLRSETAAVVAGAAMTSLRLGLSRAGLPSFPH